ncbi:MAG: hypothetical protein HRU19_31540 [Pseudobacteriovorax sp.]|nr:hypothetical protein [Pseudobacteriovorax sp.]
MRYRFMEANINTRLSGYGEVSMTGKDLESAFPLVIRTAVFTTAILSPRFRAKDVLFNIELGAVDNLSFA